MDILQDQKVTGQVSCIDWVRRRRCCCYWPCVLRRTEGLQPAVPPGLWKGPADRWMNGWPVSLPTFGPVVYCFVHFSVTASRSLLVGGREAGARPAVHQSNRCPADRWPGFSWLLTRWVLQRQRWATDSPQCMAGCGGRLFSVAVSCV